MHACHRGASRAVEPPDRSGCRARSGASHRRRAARYTVELGDRGERGNVGNKVTRLRADTRAAFALIRAEMAAMDARLSGRIDRLAERMAALPDIIMVRIGGLMVVLFGLAVSVLRYLPPVRP